MSDQVASIFQAIEYIESHLQEDITVGQIAEAAGYSLFHFMRKFNQMVHHTPYDYLMRRRLTEAARSLIHGKQRIIDVGQDYCFNDQETFSRVFRKMFQMTPSQCRKEMTIEPYQLMNAITMDDLLFINGSNFNPPSIMEHNELWLVGLMTALSEDKAEAEIQKARLFSDLESECHLQPQSELYEITFQINPQQKSGYYFVGFENSIMSESIPILVNQKVDKGRYVIMNLPETQIPLAARYIYSTWIAGAGLSIKNNMILMRWAYPKVTAEQFKTIMIPVK